MKTLYSLFFVVLFLFCSSLAFCAIEKVEGLEYVVRKLTDVPLNGNIAKRFDLYELYFENRSDKTFSIPGYSIDLGISYLTLNQINALYKNNSSKKLTVFNVAAGAAAIALGGIAKSVASTARSVNYIRQGKSNLYNDEGYLSSSKTYIIYPRENLSLLLFIDKSTEQNPNIFRFICHDEDSNVNYIVINRNLDLREVGENSNDLSSGKKSEENLISSPSQDTYK